MSDGKIRSTDVLEFYDKPEVVEYYRMATLNVGLWKSEMEVFGGVFSPDDRLIELG